MEPFLSGAAHDIVVRRTIVLPRLPSENSDRNEGAVSIMKHMCDQQCINACRTAVTEYESVRETESEEEGTHAKDCDTAVWVFRKRLDGGFSRDISRANPKFRVTVR